LQDSQCFASVTPERLVGSNAMQRQQAFDPIGVGHPFLDQSRQLAMRPARIFLLNARDPDEGARMPVPATPGLQRPQEAFRVDPIGFDAARPAVDLEAGRIHHPAGNSALNETALQPEPVRARLEDAFDLDGSPQSGFGVVPDLLDCSDERICLTPADTPP
jgi:hypothetical protein